MRDNPGDVPPSVDWPDGISPTSSREQTTKFDTSTSKSKRQIGNELEKHIGVDRWYIDESTGSQKFPGLVVRWQKDGVDYAVVSDHYTSKKANARAAYYWIHETRMREQRPVTTAQDSFAAAKLPGQTETVEARALPGDVDAPSIPLDAPPHEVLGITTDASRQTILDAYQTHIIIAHPDHGGSMREMDAVESAKEAMLHD